MRSVPVATPTEDPALTRNKNVAALNEAMRAWEKYFAEFMHEVASRCPPVNAPYSLRFFGTLPNVTLAEGVFDSRPCKIDGDDYLSSIALTCRIKPATPPKLMLFRDDIAPCETYLKSLQAVFEADVTVKNDFGQIVKCEFIVTGGPLCEIQIEADYETSSVGITMHNVREPGKISCRIPTAAFADAANGLATTCWALTTNSPYTSSPNWKRPFKRSLERK